MPENLELYVPNELGRGLQRFAFRFDGDQFAGPDFRIRYGRDSQDTPVAQKIAHGGAQAYELLQREISTGRVLLQRIGKNEYPVCLSRLIGYNPGAAENLGSFPPYAVFTYQRQTLADLADELPLRPELFRAIADGLIIALCYLQAAQMVHRHIRMETLHWDGTTVQLADYGHAAGEWQDTPGAFGEAPWDAPEQRSGAASADCRDDVYAAAILLARLATAQVFADDEEAREVIARMDLTQQHLLQDAAAEYRRDRPAAYELRKRRRLPDPLNPVLRASRGRESEARARFAALRQRQRSALRARRGAPWTNRLPGAAAPPVRAWWVKPADSGRGREPADPDPHHGTISPGPAWPNPPPRKPPASRSFVSHPPRRTAAARQSGRSPVLVYSGVACIALVVLVVVFLLA